MPFKKPIILSLIVIVLIAVWVDVFLISEEEWSFTKNHDNSGAIKTEPVQPSSLFEKNLKAAEAGNPEAQYWIAYAYHTGHEAPQSAEQAFTWYEKAAYQNYPPALYELAHAYENGFGTEKSPKRALSWYKAAADNGSALAQNRIEIAYRNAEMSLSKNEEQSFYYLDMAAQQNGKDSAYAKANLGQAYEHGIGVESDLIKAGNLYAQAVMLDQDTFAELKDKLIDYEKQCLEDIKSYGTAIYQHYACNISAGAGYPPGMYAVGKSLTESPSLEERARAIPWIQKAAKAKYPDAQITLGLYLSGYQSEVKNRQDEAYAWLATAEISPTLSEQQKTLIQVFKRQILQSMSVDQAQKTKTKADEFRKLYGAYSAP